LPVQIQWHLCCLITYTPLRLLLLPSAPVFEPLPSYSTQRTSCSVAQQRLTTLQANCSRNIITAPRVSSSLYGLLRQLYCSKHRPESTLIIARSSRSSVQSASGALVNCPHNDKDGPARDRNNQPGPTRHFQTTESDGRLLRREIPKTAEPACR
jgi:hypothetical protein